MTRLALTALGSDPGNWTGTHIQFIIVGESSSGKTAVWDVNTRDYTSYLGKVKWFGRWRKYSFYPAPDCVFEQTCLREIALFIEQRTQEQRTGT